MAKCVESISAKDTEDRHLQETADVMSVVFTVHTPGQVLINTLVIMPDCPSMQGNLSHSNPSYAQIIPINNLLFLCPTQ